MANKKILLIEPGYRNKYPPLGLMKLAQYHGPNGKQDSITFIKGPDKKVLEGVCWDRIYVTTLFSFEWKKISETIDFAIQAADRYPNKVFVGGIAASLMPEAFQEERRWRGVRFIKGLLNTAPAVSLRLEADSEELYSEDTSGTPIEDLIPDYGILSQIPYRYPVHDAYFAYASRGCVRKCSFCGVPKLEGDLYETPSLTSIVKGIEKLYGPKKDLTLMDNNIVASPKFKDIIAEIRDLGFTPGAKLKRGRVPVLRRVDFNQGVDARYLSKSPHFLQELASICTDPLRIAFDHWGFRKDYEQSIRYAHDAGLNSLSNYMLYNFHDSPEDLHARMWLNIQLNEELNIRIFSFPMRYQPTNKKDRSHVGPKWNRYYLRTMQIILHATHGIVSGTPSFFRRAFGATPDEFANLLIKPHKFVFNRDWYEELEGKPELEAYESEFKKLSQSDRDDLMGVLERFETAGSWKGLVEGISNPKVASVFRYYKPLADVEEVQIWDRQSELRARETQSVLVPDDQRVEDAGLDLEPILEKA